VPAGINTAFDGVFLGGLPAGTRRLRMRHEATDKNDWNLAVDLLIKEREDYPGLDPPILQLWFSSSENV
jgi:hypothetical protein